MWCRSTRISFSYVVAAAAFVALVASSSFFVVVAAEESEKALVAVATKEMENAALLSKLSKLFPMLSSLFIRESESSFSFKEVFNAVMKCVNRSEVALFALFGWGLLPLTKAVYELYTNLTHPNIEAESDEISKQSWFNYLVKKDQEKPKPMKEKGKIQQKIEAITPWDDDKLNQKVHEAEDKFFHREIRPFKDTYLFHVADHISQASKIGILVMSMDIITLIGKMMGYQHLVMDRTSKIFSKVAYSSWIWFRIKILKRFVLERAMGTTDLGKVNVVDNLLDGTIVVVWMLRLLEFLEVQTGFAVKSLFSVGATGTILFGLASKDIASQTMAGLSLHLSEKMYEGDKVRFSDGTNGVIIRMGWFETMIQNSDDVIVSIPNSQLTGVRVYNLSRTPHSQVKQTLRISYDDASKIPLLLDTIKEEIRQDCGDKLLPDRLRAHWSNFEDDHLQVEVDAHFEIKPSGGEYHDNRQKVLQAIYRAAEKTGVHFVVRVGN